MSIKEFLKSYKKEDTNEHRHKIFKPREEFDVSVMLDRFKKRFNMSEDDILKGLKMVDDIGLQVHFWPKQLGAVKEFLKSL